VFGSCWMPDRAGTTYYNFSCSLELAIYLVKEDANKIPYDCFLSCQVRTPKDLEGLEGIVLPGGESTAMGLIGTSSGKDSASGKNLWECLREFSRSKPTWGTCAGMILLANKCVGTSAVIQDGQALIGGIDITVCRNYFGSQISSFEMDTPPPPGTDGAAAFPGVFIRAPSILWASSDVQVLGKVMATPCRAAAVTLLELERKIAGGENVIHMGVVDALDRSSGIDYVVVMKPSSDSLDGSKESTTAVESNGNTIVLPGAADGTNAREVICAARKGNLLCTAFHPELTDDHRWHEYFVGMVRQTL
jgi:pyridoxal 5'-phosphate synthase pdxT subunit